MEIQIKDANNLNGWKSMIINDNSNFIRINKCLCCKSDLKTLIHQYDNENHKIDIGCCDNCGFITYQDKPDHKWIINFYESMWNENESDNNEFVNTKLKSSKLTEILNKIDFPKEKSICEIGTGRGGNFSALINNGYKNLIGIENSIHRAKMVNKGFPNIPIYIGGFEEDSVQNSLKKHNKFDLIYTAHVIEHIYNPEETIKLCNNLQNDNGYLIVAVPNFIGEPSMGIISFLPHLHSFTIESMINLLNNNGYEIVDKSLCTDKEVLLISKKVNNVNKTLCIKDHYKVAKEKIYNELKLSSIYDNNYYYFSKKDSRNTGIIKLSNISIIRFIQILYLNLRFKKKGFRSLIISKSKNINQKIDIVEPIIFKWNKLKLFYK